MYIKLLVHTIVWVNLSIILIIVSSYLRFLVFNEYELQRIYWHNSNTFQLKGQLTRIAIIIYD